MQCIPVDFQGLHSLSNRTPLCQILRKLWDRVLLWPHSYEIWQASQHRCCRGGCQISISISIITWLAALKYPVTWTVCSAITITPHDKLQFRPGMLTFGECWLLWINILEKLWSCFYYSPWEHKDLCSGPLAVNYTVWKHFQLYPGESSFYFVPPFVNPYMVSF